MRLGDRPSNDTLRNRAGAHMDPITHWIIVETASGWPINENLMADPDLIWAIYWPTREQAEDFIGENLGGGHACYVAKEVLHPCDPSY